MINISNKFLENGKKGDSLKVTAHKAIREYSNSQNKIYVPYNKKTVDIETIMCWRTFFVLAGAQCGSSPPLPTPATYSIRYLPHP